MPHGLGEMLSFLSVLAYLAGQLGMELFQCVLGLLGRYLGVGHPRNVARAPSKRLWQLGHNTEDARDFDFSELMMISLGYKLTKGTCNFLKDSRCELHDTALKPMQCRECFGCSSEGPDNYAMGTLWNNSEAQQLVIEWRSIVSRMSRNS
jgi:hypothetical protein